MLCSLQSLQQSSKGGQQPGKPLDVSDTRGKLRTEGFKVVRARLDIVGSVEALCEVWGQLRKSDHLPLA